MAASKKPFVKKLPPLALALFALMPIAALGTKYGAWDFRLGLLLLALSLIGSLLLQIIATLWLLRKPADPTRSALRRTSLYALPPLAVIALVLKNATGGAQLHDVSTDATEPPQFQYLLQERGEDSNPVSYSAEKAQLQAKLHPEVQAIENSASAADNFPRALAAAEAMGWRIAQQNPKQGLIEAVDTTFWFGFKDDIVIRVRDGRIDLRSVSRVGGSDLGANAERIQAFSERFQAGE